MSTVAFVGAAGACGGGEGEADDPTVLPPTEGPGVIVVGATHPGNTALTPTPTIQGVPPEGAVPRIADGPGGEGPGTLVAPLDAWDAIIEPFGAGRGPGMYHGGVDFGLDNQPNVPIYAACSGEVGVVSEYASHGTFVVVECVEPFWTTLYGQLGEVLVAPGDEVTAGDTVIANSGGPTPWGPRMLHFELRWNLLPVNPETHIDFNVRPSFTIIATPTPRPTPTSTPTTEPSPSPSASSTPTVAPVLPDAPSPQPTRPTPPTPTRTATATAAATPTFTPLIPPTPTAPQPTATATRFPTRTPVPSPTARPATPTPTPLPQVF